MKKKTWIKKKRIITVVGNCKYCGKEIINTDKEWTGISDTAELP